MKFLKTPFICLLSLAILFTSCNNDEEVNPGTPPELPPVESMTMDFSYFGGSNIGGRTMASANWERAAGVVGFWNSILVANLVIPVSAFKVAVNKTPTFDSDRGLWVWSFDYDFVGETYTAELTGEITANEVEWKMYISQEGGFQDVLWFTGVMQLDVSSGYWLLNKDASNPTEYLRIDWTRTNDAIGDIKFTYTLASAEEKGSYIAFAKTDGTDFNRAYDIYLAKNDYMVNIEWNSVTNVGHIKDPVHFQDDVFHCWDADFMDIDC